MESPPTESLSPADESAGAESSVPSSAAASHPDSEERHPEQLEASPFAALAQVVELPPNVGEHEGTQPTPLGTVRLSPPALCFVRLLGGEALVPGAPVLELTNSLRGDTQWAWEIVWRDPPHSAVLTVASLAIEHDQLVFAWTPHSKTVSAHRLLRNCALRLSAGPHTHQLALRTPVDVAPLPVNSQGKLRRLPLRIADLPDRDRLRIELTQVIGLPSVGYDPTPVLNGSGGTAWVLSGPAPEDQVLRIRVDVASERSISLSTSAYYQWSSQQQPQRLVPTRVKRLLDQLIAQRQRTAHGLEVLDQSKNQRDLPRDQATFLLRQINLGQQQLAREEEAIRKLDGLLELCGQMNDSARIHFRVYFDAGGIEVELARSREPSADP
jgi:hypothetical protein